MGRFGLTTFHNNAQFSGWDLQVWAMVGTFYFLWYVVIAVSLTVLGATRRRWERNRTTTEVLVDVVLVTTVGFLFMFTAAVANQLGHGITLGIVYAYYCNLSLLVLWILLACFVKNRLWDWVILVPLLVVNGILWARALHSANGPMDPPSPERQPR